MWGEFPTARRVPLLGWGTRGVSEYYLRGADGRRR